MISLIVPVYKNEGNIPDLLSAIDRISTQSRSGLEAIFVVDGSPDFSHLVLAQRLPLVSFPSKLIRLSRNFGAFAAIRAGLAAGRGPMYAVMAADLQEPPELVLAFESLLLGDDVDVVLGHRTGRRDRWTSRVAAGLFWAVYRRLVLREIPPGGVDVFACNSVVRDQLVALDERNSSLVGLLFWVGFRRELVPYERQQRTVGRSAWTFAKKCRYLSDSLYGFTDLPIKLLTWTGAVGLLISAILSVVVAIGKAFDLIPVPGYAATVLTITFFGALNCFGIGVLGNYVWRTFENTKGRPNFVVADVREFPPSPPARESDKPQA